ncbi:hypothetical protein D3C84_746820 [compost metagenome]
MASGSAGVGSLAGSLNNPSRLSLPSLPKRISVLGLSSSISDRCSALVQRLSICRLAYRRSKPTCSLPGSPMTRPQRVTSRLNGLSSIRWIVAGVVA